MSEPQGNKSTDDRAPTPGPWKVNKYGSIGGGQYGTLPIVAAVEPLEGMDRKYGDHLANARLIAAAPDMEALLKEMEDWLRPEVVEEPDRTFFWKIVQLRRSIAGKEELFEVPDFMKERKA